MKYEFGKNIVLMYMPSGICGRPYIWAETEDGEDEITANIAGVPLNENEVIMNHDLFTNKPLVTALAEYIANETREITFGSFNTRTLVLKLKDNWKELCVPMC